MDYTNLCIVQTVIFVFLCILLYIGCMVHDIREDYREIKRELFRMKLTIDNVDINTKYRKD